MWQVGERIFDMSTDKVGTIVGSFGAKFYWVKFDHNGRTLCVYHADLMFHKE